MKDDDAEQRDGLESLRTTIARAAEFEAALKAGTLQINLNEAGKQQARLDFLRSAVVDFATLVRPMIALMAFSSTTPDDKRKALRGFLDLMRLVAPRGTPISEAIRGLNALDYGETQSLFKAAVIARRSHPQEGAYLWSKLSALAWQKILVNEFAFTIKESQYQVGIAFDEDWSTIKFWMRQCRRLISAENLNIAFFRASFATSLSLADESWQDALERDGLAYQCLRQVARKKQP